MPMTSSMLTSPTTCLHTAILFVFSTIFYTTIVTCSKPDISYREHCASIVPESKPSASPQFVTIPFPPNQNGYFLGGERILDQPNNSSNYYYVRKDRKVLSFQTHHVYSTDANDVFKVEASLILFPDANYYVEDLSYSYSFSTQVFSSRSQSGPLSFELEGFWSKSTGKLCMVGSSSTSSQEGKLRVLPAVLKVNDVRSSSNLTSLLGGTLESLSSADDSSYFDQISLLIFPKMNYNYTAVADYGCTGGVHVPKELSLSLPLSKPICSIFSTWVNSFELEYASGCNSTKSCNIFGEDAGYLPQVMALTMIQCSEDRQSLRFLVEFPNTSYVGYYRPFNPNTTLVAEGSWDSNKNQLCLVACQILNATNSLSSSHVGDCSIRLSLRFPAVWSIGNTSGIVGQVWSNKPAKDSGYFDKITLRSDENYLIPGLKYEYTLVDKARKSCEEKKPRRTKDKKPSRSEERQYPDGNSYDMRLFNMNYKNSKGRRVGWGDSKPIFVGDQIATNSLTQARTHSRSQQNISYQMSLTPINASKEYTTIQFLAEGIYDAETGSLCMAACKYLVSDSKTPTKDSMDCEIFVNVQFPPIYSNDYMIKGSITSKREKSAPLYFEPLTISARSSYTSRAGESIWRMDLEIIMALISNTLVCVFVGYQILYVKKHPSAFPFISLVMLVLLTLGQMIPLVLNFEALFFSKQNRDTFLIRTGGWLEVNEVIVRVVTMVGFLLQFRLLQLVWSARLADGNQKASWVAEKKTLFVSLPLYVAGILLALIVHWKNSKLGEEMYYSTYINGHQHSLWEDLRSYAGLVLDGFLLPQILLNIFQNPIENALSNFFYMGTTFVRLLPHAYDLYRAHYYVEDFDGSYIYADPGTDYYSTAWDVIIPLGGLLFAAIIYLQQRFGGCFCLPRRDKVEGYEKVPVANDA